MFWTYFVLAVVSSFFPVVAVVIREVWDSTFAAVVALLITCLGVAVTLSWLDTLNILARLGA